MENNVVIPDTRKIESLKKNVEIAISEAKDLDLSYTANLLKIVQESIVQEINKNIKVVELD